MFEILSLLNIVIFLRFCYVCLKRNIGDLNEYTVLVIAIIISEIAMYTFKDNLSNLFSFSFYWLGVSLYFIIIYLNFKNYLFKNFELIGKIFYATAFIIMVVSMVLNSVSLVTLGTSIIKN